MVIKQPLAGRGNSSHWLAPNLFVLSRLGQRAGGSLLQRF